MSMVPSVKGVGQYVHGISLPALEFPVDRSFRQGLHFEMSGCRLAVDCGL